MDASLAAESPDVHPGWVAAPACVLKRRPSAYLPDVVSGQERKDLATPRTVYAVMLKRLGMRRSRGAAGGVRKVVLKHTDATRLKLAAVLPEKSTKKQAFLWRFVHAVRPEPASRNLGQVVCSLCWCTRPEDCACGASLVEHHCQESLEKFYEFAHSPSNPMMHPWDPEDQREILKAIQNAVPTPPEQTWGGLFALCVLGGLTGRASTLETVGPAVVLQDWQGAQEKVEELVGGNNPVYRGGQHPGTIAPLSVVDMVKRVVEHQSLKAIPHLASLRAGGGEVVSSRRAAVRAIINDVAALEHNKDFSGVSSYKCKRICEIILLAAYGGICGLHAEQADLRVIVDIYSLPKNSMTALKTIFPSATTPALQREALRVLQRLDYWRDICSLVAILCFWTEQASGKVQWIVTPNRCRFRAKLNLNGIVEAGPL